MVHVVTIKNKVQLYKGEETATSIEMLELQEFGFTLVSQKDLYQVGDKALFIEPDFNLPYNNPLFDSFVKPGGDPKKSKLGKNGRIRAVKFNLHKGDNQPVYSNGILLSFDEVAKYVSGDLEDTTNVANQLGIYKYQEERDHVGGKIGNPQKERSYWPDQVYKTDEPNENKVRWNYPLHLVCQVKMDGSSITLLYKKGKATICSRNQVKPLTIKKQVGFDSSWWAWFKSWFGVDRVIYEEVENDSPFVQIGLPYLKKLVHYCENATEEMNKAIILRGELVGQGASGGSGNKNNLDAKLSPDIYFFGADYYIDGKAVRMPFENYYNLILDLGFPTPKIAFKRTFETREDLLNLCNSYFVHDPIEGIVARSLDGALSCKIMNLDYDAKK